jgi:23S rRNA (uracil1939-C5)-methyltransferase
MPPRPGDIIDLSIETLAYGGQGLAHVDGFVVFVRGAVPGDVVRAQVTKRKRSYAEARLLGLSKPSSLRVAPACGHAESCGGCEWQTVDYRAQLEYKQRQVLESLRHIGGLDGFVVEPICGMDMPWRYRNKMEFSFGSDQQGRLVLGLHRRGSWREVIELDDCWLASERINTARWAVADACRELGLAPYSQATHEGLVRHLVVREGLASGDLLINLYIRHRFEAEAELAAAVSARLPVTTFAVTVNAELADAAVGGEPVCLIGPPWFREELAAVPLRVPATAFLQTNSAMCSVLYEMALRFATPTPDDAVYDLYCGIGALTLLLGRHAGRVHGIEMQDEAIAAAWENARLTQADGVTFSAGDVRRLLKDPALMEVRGMDEPRVVVVDPPRAGMAPKALARAAALGARRLVYVSCNPTTLASNGAQLRDLGYVLTRVAPVDMFPQTHHIETVALFERSEGAAPRN